MKRSLLTAALVFGLIMSFWSGSSAQGIGRSKGLGIRTSFWNVTGEPTQITLSNETGQAVDAFQIAIKQSKDCDIGYIKKLRAEARETVRELLR